MNLYNRSEDKRNILHKLNSLIDTIPAGDTECHINLSWYEFKLMKEHFGWKTGLFRAWPKYRGITIIGSGFPK